MKKRKDNAMITMKNSKMRKVLPILLTLTLIITSVGFSTVHVSAATKAPKKITLKVTSKTVDIKGKVTASVKSVSPAKASKAVTWKSSNKKIATVSSKGVVTGKKSGKVKITATSKKNKRVKKYVTITVKNLKPQLSGLPKTLSLYPGGKKILKAKVGPVGVYNKGITWKSSNTSVATVSGNGTVTAKKAGSAVITVSSKESSKYKASCKVTVGTYVTKLTFDQKKVELVAGDSYINKLAVEPVGVTNKAISFKSSNTGVATVAADGKVTAKKEGSAIITAEAKDGSKKSASYQLSVLKDTSIYSAKGNANQYRIRPEVLNYKQENGQPYISTVGQWRKDNHKNDKETYFVNGEALSNDDIIVSNGKIGMVLAVGTRNPWGYPAGSVLDAGYFKEGKPARDTIWSLEFLMNGWDSWAPENCGQVTFDLVNYDFTACAEKEDGLPALKVSRDYTVLKDAAEKACDLDVVTYYSIGKDAEYAYMYDTVINNGKADVNGKTTRFALTNKGDDGGSLKYLKKERAVMSYGNKEGQEYAICYTVPKTQKDSKVNVDGKGGSLGYKELRGNCSYKANSTTTYQEYFSISDKADTAKLTDFLNEVNGESTITVKGTVKAASGSAVVPNAVIVAEDEDGNTCGFYTADKDGKFSIQLPKGVYGLSVEKKGHAKGDSVDIVRSKTVTLRAGAEKSDLKINLKDKDGKTVWGKTELIGEYPEVRYTGDSVYQAHKKGMIDSKVSDPKNFEATIYGEGYYFYSEPVTVKVEDGVLKTPASGVSYNNGTLDVTVNMEYSSTDGWLSGDMHHHGNKNDGFANPEDVIPSVMASGLDISFITDHDFTVNNFKTFNLINNTYKGEIAGFVPSEEISCSWAHFNVLAQDEKSYNYFLDENVDNHVMDQFGKFPDFVKQTHDTGANITANHPWYSYGLFYTALFGANGVPGGYEDSYDTVEINSCSSDQENADTIISLQNLWSGYLTNGTFFGKTIEKPHYLVAGSDTHDVLIPGVTNKGGDYNASGYKGFARGESEHYNTGKVRTFSNVGDVKGKSTKETGLAFAQAAAKGHSYISFGPVLTLGQTPGEGNQYTASEDSTVALNVKIDSLAKIKDVLVLTKDAKDQYQEGSLIGAYQDQKYIKYDKGLSKMNINKKNVDYEIKVPVKDGEKTWAAILVMDENGNYAMTNPYWLSGK